MNLGGMSGIDLQRQLRAEASAVPIIITFSGDAFLALVGSIADQTHT